MLKKRNRALLLSLVGIVLATCAFAAELPLVDPYLREPVTTRAPAVGRVMVAGDFPQSATAAFKILEKGGNAFDAAVGMVATMSVVNQTMNDFFGGDAMIIVYSAKEKKLFTYNGSGWSPEAATIDFYIDKGGMPPAGMLTVQVPGSFSGWMMLLQDYGTLPLKDILAPAIYIADNGYPLESRSAKAKKDRLNEEALKVYAPGGVPLKSGEIAYNKNFAATLKQIENMDYKEAEDYFYRGPLAKKIVEFSKANGGLLSEKDFADFKAEKTTPLSTNYKGLDVFVCPPNSQGMVLLEALNIVEGYDLKAMGHNSAQYVDVLVQALNLSLEDRNRHMGDPRFVKIPVGMISKEYAKQRREKDMHPGKPMGDNLVPGKPADFEAAYKKERGGDTTFMAVADAEGNIVACTTSICDSFGSGLMVPELGIMLNNRMTYFLLDEEYPNHLKPHKRTIQTITPSIVMKDEKPCLVFGTPGGDLQEQSKLQTFLNIVEFGMTPQQAVEAPRFQSRHPMGLLSSYRATFPRTIGMEGRIPEAVRDELTKMNYVVESKYGWDYRGYMGVIKIDPETGWKEAGVDPRGWNTAIGW